MLLELGGGGDTGDTRGEGDTGGVQRGNMYVHVHTHPIVSPWEIPSCVHTSLHVPIPAHTLDTS